MNRVKEQVQSPGCALPLRISAQRRSLRQELGHRLTVLREQLAQLNLKHERYEEVTRISERDGAELKSLLAAMEQGTKVSLDRLATVG